MERAGLADQNGSKCKDKMGIKNCRIKMEREAPADKD